MNVENQHGVIITGVQDVNMIRYIRAVCVAQICRGQELLDVGNVLEW